MVVYKANDIGKEVSCLTGVTCAILKVCGVGKLFGTYYLGDAPYRSMGRSRFVQSMACFLAVRLSALSFA